MSTATQPLDIQDMAAIWAREPVAGIAAASRGSANGAQEELELQYLLPSGVPALPQPRLRLVDPISPREQTPAADSKRYLRRILPKIERGFKDEFDADDDFANRQPSGTASLPEPKPWVAKLAQAILEVRAGLRPAHQLSRWTTYALHSALVEAQSNADRRDLNRDRIRSVHITHPADGVVEASAVVIGAKRCRAMAMRFEGWDGRWLCVAADLI